MVYLLELSSLKFTLITTSDDAVHIWLDQVVFAPGTSACGPDWQHLVLVWGMLPEPSTCDYDVHNRLGQRVAGFEQQDWGDKGSAPAFAKAGRIAVASGSSLVVWDLMSGQHLGTRRHPARASNLLGPPGNSDWERMGVVAANSMGSKLASVAAKACDIHLYDALTLEKIGCVRADRMHAGCMPPLHYAMLPPLSMVSTAGPCCTLTI